MTQESNHEEFVQTRAALLALARNIQRQQDELERKIARTISSKIIPLIEELRQGGVPERCLVKLDILSAYLEELTPGVKMKGVVITALSSSESRVAAMIQQGFSTLEIARLLRLSEHTVKSHRRAIRKKLGIWNSEIDLSSYLKSKLIQETGSGSDSI